MSVHRTLTNARSRAAADPDDDEKRCPRCDKNDSDAEFCKKCGRKLHRETTEGSKKAHASRVLQSSTAALARNVRATARELGLTPGDVLKQVKASPQQIASLGLSPLELVSTNVAKASGLMRDSTNLDEDGEVALLSPASAKALHEQMQDSFRSLR